MSNLYITGSSGVIGREIAKYLRLKKIHFIPIYRNINSKLRSYNIENNNLAIFSLNKINYDKNYIIHCAYNFQDKNIINNSNLLALESIKFFFPHSIIINISTISAFDGCISKYGKIKLLIERSLPLNSYNLRLGVPVSTNIIGFQKVAFKISKILPFFTFAITKKNGCEMYLTNMEAYCDVIRDIIFNEKYKPGTYSVVYGESVEMKDYMKQVTSKKVVSINWLLLFIIFRILELCHLNFRFGSDSVIGLAFSPNKIKNNIYKS